MNLTVQNSQLKFSQVKPQKIFIIAVPEPPVIWEVKDETSSNKFTIQWNETTKPNGIINSYKVAISFLNFSSPIPNRCNDDFEKSFEKIVRTGEQNQYIFLSALPFASYIVQVFANNSAAISAPSQKVEIKTISGI
jgi:hypothetical protein